jgi:hypothetical protein
MSEKGPWPTILLSILDAGSSRQSGHKLDRSAFVVGLPTSEMKSRAVDGGAFCVSD